MDSAERTGTPTGWGGEVTEGSGGRGVHAAVCPPNGSILLKCEACTFLTRYNKSISCVRVCVACACVRCMCVRAMHEEEIGGI